MATILCDDERLLAAQRRYDEKVRREADEARQRDAAGVIGLFTQTRQADVLWASWAAERFGLSTQWERDHLRQFATFGISDSDCVEVTGMTEAGWARLVEFTDLARKEGRKLSGLSTEEQMKNISQFLLVTSSEELV